MKPESYTLKKKKKKENGGAAQELKLDEWKKMILKLKLAHICTTPFSYPVL